MSQSFSSNFCNYVNYSNCNVLNSFTPVSDDRSDLLAWLSLLDPKSRHRDIQGRRVDNIGEWLIHTEEFRSWYAGGRGGEPDNAVLFCYGGLGAGKTYIR